MASEPRRAVLLGGAHGTVALARSLKAAGLEVWFLTDDTNIACFSRAVGRVVRWCGAGHPLALRALEEVADANSLRGSILIPAGDAEVRLVAEAHERLSSRFVVLTADWSQLRWACDKALAYERAASLGLGVPRVYDAAQIADVSQLQYPLVLKPAMRRQRNRLADAKAWQVNDWTEFGALYKAAAELVGDDNVIVQQLIPGGGENQVSYAGVWNSGEPVVSFTARRLRQYPVDFGYTSTFVETVRLDDVSLAAETFLRSIRHHGLVEVEFKRDPRDGSLKLLDVNPRPWSWLSLAAAAGIDLGAAIACIASARPVPDMRAREGVAWLFLLRDLVALAQLHGLAAVPTCAASWRRVRAAAAFAWTDPLPGIVDLPLTVMRVLGRRFKTGPR